MQIGDDTEDYGFAQMLYIKIGDGTKTPFWHSRWIGHQTLRSAFPTLFSCVQNPGGSVDSMGERVGMEWQWNIYIREHMDHAQVQQEKEELLIILKEVEPITAIRDKYVWSLGGHEGFKVKDYYWKLQEDRDGDGMVMENRTAINIIWKASMPSKVKIFAWRMLKDRIPTRSQLKHRNIIEDDDACRCVFGCPTIEDTQHLFMDCIKARKVWNLIYQWLGIYVDMNVDCGNHLLQFVETLKQHCPVKRAVAIWAAVCWCYWKLRNEIVFENGNEDLEGMVHKVKMFTWWWMAIGSKTKLGCSFYEWHNYPLLCMS
ncbi:uncharacterized protein LOC131648455 [Vicia villosa]|uniref:uncharacterized protein LOC131648455 n=1 Tax=Vicia villosa TaxID=3911 RepID=UPI00273B010F|nr:uncharacterized protein LOC131648455 [Vicia villosa]